MLYHKRRKILNLLTQNELLKEIYYDHPKESKI